MILRRALLIASSLALSSCGAESAALSDAPPPAAQAPAPTPSPSPSPAPAPTPTPSPPPNTPQAIGDGKIVVVSEGSSSAVAWSGSHTGMYAASRSDIQFHGLAVGGSGIETMTARRDVVLTAKPDLVSIYIGSNDIGPDVDGFIAKLKAYVDPIRAAGARVVICTLLPKQVTNVTYSAEFNTIRKQFNDKMKQVAWIDGIADFGGHPIMGQDSAPFDRTYFEADGQHMTVAGHTQVLTVYKPAMDKLIADVR